jgi:arylsulfatase
MALSFWRWPERLTPADVTALSAHVDFFPTLAELAGAKLSRSVRKQLEGRSLVPLLEHPEATMSDRMLVTHVGRWPKGTVQDEWKYKGCSIRNTRWHLVSPDGGREPKWQLFDVQADPGEKLNVATANPAVVATLSQAFDDWWLEVQPQLVNEKVVGPHINPFKEIYWKQFGGGPTETLLKEMDPHRRLESPQPAARTQTP